MDEGQAVHRARHVLIAKHNTYVIPEVKNIQRFGCGRSQNDLKSSVFNECNFENGAVKRLVFHK